jgi:hypothetical protein
MPNGTDFWWDEFFTNRANCWYGNLGPDGSGGSVTGSGEAGSFPGLPPNILPDCAGGTNQELSVGNGDVAKEAYLVECAEGPKKSPGPIPCDWYTAPPKPGSPEAAQQRAQYDAMGRSYAESPQGQALKKTLENLVAGTGR